MQMNISCKKIINRFLKFFMISRIRTTEKVVYLTFDDGPEPGITEFILNELNKYGFYATFFCCGKNVQQNPTLYNKIILNKHSVGSHTYNHLDGFKTPSKEYLDDEEKSSKILGNTILFRPPWACISISSFLKLKKERKIIYWSLISQDANLHTFNCKDALEYMIKRTKPGDIVLFHFSNEHESRTKQILPLYCKWLFDNDYTSKKLDL